MGCHFGASQHLAFMWRDPRRARAKMAALTSSSSHSDPPLLDLEFIAVLSSLAGAAIPGTVVQYQGWVQWRRLSTCAEAIRRCNGLKCVAVRDKTSPLKIERVQNFLDKERLQVQN